MSGESEERSGKVSSKEEKKLEREEMTSDGKMNRFAKMKIDQQ